MDSITTQKSVLRQYLKSQRAGISQSSRESFNQRIFQVLTTMEQYKNANSIFCFVSSGTEVDTHQLINHALSTGRKLAVPRIVDGKTMIAVTMQNWDELKPGKLRILTPISSKPCKDKFDICITPGLGFTRIGDRIGFGRGYYDQWFCKNITYKIALAFECQVVDKIPVQESDIKVDAVVTEKGIIDCTDYS